MSCYAVCHKSRTSAGHLGTAEHRRNAERLSRPGRTSAGRPGWMVAIRSNPDDQYAGQWPCYSPIGIGPLLADAERIAGTDRQEGSALS